MTASFTQPVSLQAPGVSARSGWETTRLFELGLLVVCAIVGGCSGRVDTPPVSKELQRVEYTPPDIPLVRRKQVYREVQKLIHDFEEKTRHIREQFVEGRISAEEREQLLKEARERYDFDLKATLGRYGLRLKDLPNIIAEARDKGWDE
ncbi:MAG: hypothetical protein NZ899_02360 [Thermoguttaceae bacterium]|nr:hypothetical protein [Thermoguttaceae bacterium]MDW8079831.1 hypothetical protein [Thermoguttaceae bacterium]